MQTGGKKRKYSIDNINQGEEMCTYLAFISFFLIFKSAFILWRWIVCFQPLDEAVQFDVVGFFFCFFYFSDSTSTSTSTSSSIKLHHSFRICLQYGCWFGGKLIQKLRQKEVDEESCVKRNCSRYILLSGHPSDLPKPQGLTLASISSNVMRTLCVLTNYANTVIVYSIPLHLDLSFPISVRESSVSNVAGGSLQEMVPVKGSGFVGKVVAGGGYWILYKYNFFLRSVPCGKCGLSYNADTLQVSRNLVTDQELCTDSKSIVLSSPSYNAITFRRLQCYSQVFRRIYSRPQPTELLRGPGYSSSLKPSPNPLLHIVLVLRSLTMSEIHTIRLSFILPPHHLHTTLLLLRCTMITVPLKEGLGVETDGDSRMRDRKLLRRTNSYIAATLHMAESPDVHRIGMRTAFSAVLQRMGTQNGWC
ncbi:hypothetical protein Tco_0121067 [Tanacetum coccineum]